VARKVLGASAETFPDDAGQLIDQLVVVDEPQAGDLVCYWREATDEDGLGDYGWDAGSELTSNLDDDGDDQSPVFHVMIVVDKDTVVGACDLAGEVKELPLHYEARWHLIPKSSDSPTPYRRLQLR
jgi:hypothetical protein